MMATWAQRFATAIERPAIAYSMVVGAVAASSAVQGVLELVLTGPPAFMIYYPAIIFATVVAGARGGLSAVALSALVAAVLWPAEARAGATLPVSVGLFIFTGGLTVALAKPLRVAIQRGAAVQERFRIAQRAAKDSFVILDPVRENGEVVDFVWIYANTAADRMAPSGVSTLVGRRVLEVFPDDTGQAMFERLRSGLSQDEADEVEVRRTIDGQEHWLRSSVMRVGVGVAATFRDVTEQRMAVQALRQGEARVRAFVESLPQLMWVSDAQGAWTFASSQWFDFTGQAPGDPLGDGWLAVVHPEDCDAVAEAWRQAVQNLLPFAPQFRLRRADGAFRWFHGRASPLLDPDGEVRRWFGSASDVTEVLEAQQDLEVRVAQRTRDLEASLEAKARTEAALAQAQRLETVGRLTGGVAHDFNNLLTVVIGGLDMILKNPADQTRVERLAAAALAAGRRGERLTRQLLAFSRRQELRLDNLAVAPLIEQIEPLVRRAAGEAIHLVIDCAADVGAARLDAAQFEAAILNLVVNAADATPAGGEIRIEVRRVRLDADQVRETPAGNYVRLSVADTGAGMAPDVLEHVFEPFFTTKETGKGTGLGLAQVYGFIRQCGGGVDIQSAPGEGSTINLYLPAAEVAGVLALDAEDQAAEPVIGGLRILLVEDDDAVRAVTEGLLNDLGCQVETATTGAEALARLGRSVDFDLVLSDIVMPGGVSGVDLARQLRRDHPDLPVVLATGYSGETLDDPEEAEAWPILRKPFRAEQLSSAVRQAAGG
ncbi:MAG: PAS domain S-box protein [Phenylobacterium sp.]|uniref:hybrid sensor histidine kinase/response regulator n=1 Tax=Phenylobacterium sp. TaxID=1871053 RepID=UPI00271EC04B|nr:PAS domain-containing sensor histidine kinase [Phenylobacterium sp.]MDO8900006.1 PAS domain S-box protein [Phenylobacterium sp.]MDP2213416.1 PAS domain S-box protein [Phenylobacterium sp.]